MNDKHVRSVVQNNGNSQYFQYHLISTFRLLYRHHQDTCECCSKITKTIYITNKGSVLSLSTQLN